MRLHGGNDLTDLGAYEFSGCVGHLPERVEGRLCSACVGLALEQPERVLDELTLALRGAGPVRRVARQASDEIGASLPCHHLGLLLVPGLIRTRPISAYIESSYRSLPRILHRAG